jgi:hypothetical protein
LWALLCLPLVCAAGFIEHACECGDPVCCSHEEACPTDPCSAVTLRAASGTDQIVFQLGHGPATDVTAIGIEGPSVESVSPRPAHSFARAPNAPMVHRPLLL